MKGVKMNNKGFTIIELMVVITIIGILASAAMPSMSSKIMQSKIESSLILADIAKEDIQKYYQKHKTMPKNNDQVNLPAPDKFISNYTTKIEVINGAIHMTLGNKVPDQALGKVVSIRPAIIKGEPRIPISWIIGYASVPKGMTALGENLTDVDSSFLSYEYRW